jgi:hypothetical protein
MVMFGLTALPQVSGALVPAEPVMATGAFALVCWMGALLSLAVLAVLVAATVRERPLPSRASARLRPTLLHRP